MKVAIESSQNLSNDGLEKTVDVWNKKN